MEKILGDAYTTIKHKIDVVIDKIYKLDMAKLKTYKYVESRQIVYLIFKKIDKNSNMPRVLYVGKTSQTIDKRFKQHMSNIKEMVDGSKEWTSKYLWMFQVIQSGGELIAIELNKVPSSKVYEFEQEWIDYLTKCDFKLLNKTNSNYYNKKVAKI